MIDLGKYAFEVLTSYGIAILLLGGLIGFSVSRQRKIRQQIRKIQDNN